jgi:hypothetical protein
MGFAFCNGQCQQMKQDPQHCGPCGVKCSEGMTCIGGACM